jgi:hypothetical protein
LDVGNKADTTEDNQSYWPVVPNLFTENEGFSGDRGGGYEGG